MLYIRRHDAGRGRDGAAALVLFRNRAREGRTGGAADGTASRSVVETGDADDCTRDQ